MRGPRLFDHTDWNNKKKKVCTSIFRCPVLLENISEERKKGLFLLFVMRPLIFFEALGFSLLSLLINPALSGAAQCTPLKNVHRKPLSTRPRCSKT